MIIDVVKSKGVPYKCDNCKAYFAWKPDGQGVCHITMEHPKCGKSECIYYAPVRKKCPECGSDDISEIPAIVYKFMREFRRVKQDD